MRLTAVGGRVMLRFEDLWVDVADASSGAFGPGLADLLLDWDHFRGWATRALGGRAAPAAPTTVDLRSADALVDRPRQVFIVGLSYRTHAEEVGLPIPRVPPVLTKFPSSIAPPGADLLLPSERVDSEIEIVAVIGRGGSCIPAGRGLDRVAGLAVGQDFSERRVQIRGESPALAKSLPGFTRFGPELVTLEEIDDVQDLRLESRLNGEVFQSDSSASMLWPIGEIVEYVSRFCTLFPGDLVFTGTPAGIGMARRPQRFLRPGDELVSWIDHLGTQVVRCAPSAAQDDLLRALPG